MPVFKNLLEPAYNKIVLDLLFLLATWQSLVKLQLHTDTTLTLLENVTKEFGRQLHQFTAKLCNNISTRWLPKEVEAITCRHAKVQSKSSSSISTSKSEANKKAEKKCNPNIYKIHAMGGYVQHIQWFGSTDSYLTQQVCTDYYFEGFQICYLTDRVSLITVRQSSCIVEQTKGR